MKSRILGLLAVALSGVSGVALSSPVAYDFTVAATSGPLDGDVATGSFTFDSSIAPAGGGFVSQPALLTDLSFTWDGIAYNSSTANTGALAFNPAGTLIFARFGDDCDAFGGCAVSAGTEDWFVNGGPGFANTGFAYATPSSSVFEGTFLFSPAPSSVPEPATLSLLALGLAGAGFITRRKKKLTAP